MLPQQPPAIGAVQRDGCCDAAGSRVREDSEEGNGYCKQ